MARIRNIKPSFFRSQSLAKCSVEARITFAGLWTEADDEGRGDATARLIATALWPWDGPTDEQVDGWLTELAAEHILLYEAKGKRYFQIVNFDEHQSAAYRRGTSKLPAPDGTTPEPPDPVDNPPRTTRRVLARQDVQESAGREGKGREDEKETERNAPADSAVTPEDAHGESVSEPPLEITERHHAIAKAFGTESTTRAIAAGRKVGKFNAYAQSIASTALANPELFRLAALFPTAPPNIISATMLGEKASLQHYPRADEIAGAPLASKLATVTHLHTKEQPA